MDGLAKNYAFWSLRELINNIKVEMSNDLPWKVLDVCSRVFLLWQQNQGLLNNERFYLLLLLAWDQEKNLSPH